MTSETTRRPLSTARSQRLLKAAAARGLGSRVVFNYDDVRRQCDEHLEAVRRQTRDLIEATRREADQIRRQASADGHADGRSAGLKDAARQIEAQATERAHKLADERLATVLPALESAAAQLAEVRDQWQGEWEQGVVRLGVAIAEKLLRRTLSARPESVRDLLAEPLRLAAGNGRITLRLNPLDIDALGDQFEAVLAAMAAGSEVSLTADSALSRGSTVVETGHGTIDARIETQLTRIAEELLGVN